MMLATYLTAYMNNYMKLSGALLVYFFESPPYAKPT